MHIAILTNVFKSYSNEEVEKDLVEFGYNVKNALELYGHKATLFDIDNKAFEKLGKENIDIAFNVCERINGNALFEPHVASMLEILNIPFTGSSSFTLAVCMHKAKVRGILKANNIPTPNYQIFYSCDEKLKLELDFPVIVKPESSHNSIGILNNAVAKNIRELRKNIKNIIKNLNQPAIAEEFISGREFGIGILGNKNPKILPFSEVIYSKALLPEERILSYNAKWHPTSRIYKSTPYKYNIQLSSNLKEKISEIALRCYKIFDIRDYGTVEIRLDNNKPKVLEINPNPGLSGHSVIPKMIENNGKKYPELIESILNYALKRYGVKT